MSFVLRPYQVSGVDAAWRELQTRRRALLEAATGTGKTVMFAALSERWRPHGRVLILAHREELLSQAADKIGSSTMLSTGIERADLRVRDPLPDVVIASVQTLCRKERLALFAREAFGLIIVDEAHHATSPSYRAILDYFSAARLGVTATPARADGASLSPIFGNTAFRYQLRRAIREGYLADIRRTVEMVPGLDLTRVRVRAGDFDAADLEAELLKAPAVAAVAAAIVRRTAKRPTIAFCAGVLHSRAVAAAINALEPGTAVSADGEQREGVAEFTAGRALRLCNADLTTEGFDFPPTEVIARVRPTKSLGRATQQVGRGTRLSDGKRFMESIEFVGGSASGQVSTVDVVGVDFSPRVRAMAEHMLDRQPTLSVLDALDTCAAQAKEAATARIAPVAHALVDPMKIILGLDGMVMEPPRRGAMRASPAQIDLLAKEGLQVSGLDVRQAALLLDGIRWRRGRGRSSPAQALTLYRYGFDLECTATEASRRLAQMRVA